MITILSVSISMPGWALNPLGLPENFVGFANCNAPVLILRLLGHLMQAKAIAAGRLRKQKDHPLPEDHEG
ncbi:hypothetical protein AUM56_20910 [Cronobacter sakazakii]|nr:hypothetical protein [Cronobacter sakazakii]EGT4290650.1 hypothetical protein [Cronobacter malonaticus]EGT4261505.1 hypothetical protein [Cronobacter sakazakii]EGT4273575.1 hypothetical protein [Cronobacter sakazakii]EGT4303424.1 hypothetical protein [Cronobacter sakazakii]